MERQWFQEKWFVASGAFLGLIVVTGVFVLVTSGGGDGGSRTGARAQSGSARPSGTPSVSVASSSMCGLPDGDQRIPKQPPAARWQLVGWFATPTARNIGPGVVNGKQRRCYAHSPTGALFAAIGWLGCLRQRPTTRTSFATW